VFPDADLEQAVQTTITAIFFNTGECCCAGSRLFVHEDIKDEFLDELAAAAEDLTVDDPLLDATDLGPKVTAEQVERTMSYIEEGRTVQGGLCHRRQPARRRSPVGRLFRCANTDR